MNFDEQSPFAYQVLKEGGNRDLKPSLTEHYIMELEHELSPQTELKLAVYYKDMQRIGHEICFSFPLILVLESYTNFRQCYLLKRLQSASKDAMMRLK